MILESSSLVSLDLASVPESLDHLPTRKEQGVMLCQFLSSYNGMKQVDTVTMKSLPVVIGLVSFK